MYVVLPLDEHWDSYVRFTAEDGHPVITELRILPTLMDQPLNGIIPTFDGGDWRPDAPDGGDWRPDAPEGGLTSRALRRVHLGRALELAYEQLERWLDRDQRSGRPMPSKFTREAVSAPRRPGSKGRDDRFYVAVASLYVEALERGSRRPVVDAAQELSAKRRGVFEPAYVRDVLHVARQRGLLSRPPKGRAGGQLTDKARALLQREEAE